MKYTIEEFRKEYPNDAACLDKLFKMRFGNLEACPCCGVAEPKFNRITTRRSYQCRDCYYQIYPTAGTIFEKTTTPLNYWFYAMFLMTTTRNGVAAKELERALGVTYKTAWRMAKLLRDLMGFTNTTSKLKGQVEMDETYVNHGKKDKTIGRSSRNQSPVFGMVERNGNVRAFALENVKKNIIFPLIKKHIDASANISTDEYPLYTNIEPELGIKHGSIKHALKQYRDGSISTNTIEGFFSQLKRSINGTYLHVSKKHIAGYVSECVFRYNNRKNQSQMFENFINQIKVPVLKN